MRALEGSAFIRFQSLSQIESAFTAVVSFRRRVTKAWFTSVRFSLSKANFLPLTLKHL
jgi:hypothetical protein